MEWKEFAIYNALGGATWVTSMALIGYAFAAQFETLLGYFEKASWVFAGGIFIGGYFLWRRQKKHFKQREAHQPAA